MIKIQTFYFCSEKRQRERESTTDSCCLEELSHSNPDEEMTIPI